MKSESYSKRIYTKDDHSEWKDVYPKGIYYNTYKYDINFGFVVSILPKAERRLGCIEIGLMIFGYYIAIGYRFRDEVYEH